jgi:hypothetical protein
MINDIINNKKIVPKNKNKQQEKLPYINIDSA